eukprot:2927807-Amphidinium_carterae.1
MPTTLCVAAYWLYVAAVCGALGEHGALSIRFAQWAHMGEAAPYRLELAKSDRSTCVASKVGSS